MMNEKYNAPNSPCCGRPMHYAAADKCNYNDCCLDEYPSKMPACIRKKSYDCMAKAVIPAVTVESVEGITNLANCFVHVTDINTTFYIDDKHRPMIIWSGDVEVSLPSDIQTDEQWTEFVNSFDLREQFLYVKFFDSGNNKNMISSFYFNKTGKAYRSGDFEEITEA